MKSPWHVRDAGRHHPLAGASRHRSRSRLDRGAAHLKDEIMPKYAELIYNGFWFSPRGARCWQALIDKSQELVTGARDAQALQGLGPG